MDGMGLIVTDTSPTRLLWDPANVWARGQNLDELVESLCLTSVHRCWSFEPRGRPKRYTLRHDAGIDRLRRRASMSQVI